MARFFFCFLVALWSACSASSAAEPPALTAPAVARLITAAEKNVKDPQGWADDLLDVLKLHDLSASKENICAAIAIIDQESSFVANPAVAGLGKISEKALRTKMDKVPVLGRLALRFLEIEPSPADNYLARIRAARTERDLDLVYRAMVADAAKQSGLGRLINSGLLNRQIDGRNEIDTIGSMQVSVDFALETAKGGAGCPCRWTMFTPCAMNSTPAMAACITASSCCWVTKRVTTASSIALPISTPAAIQAATRRFKARLPN